MQEAAAISAAQECRTPQTWQRSRSRRASLNMYKGVAASRGIEVNGVRAPLACGRRRAACGKRHAGASAVTLSSYRRVTLAAARRAHSHHRLADAHDSPRATTLINTDFLPSHGAPTPLRNSLYLISGTIHHINIHKRKSATVATETLAADWNARWCQPLYIARMAPMFTIRFRGWNTFAARAHVGREMWSAVKLDLHLYRV